MPIGSMSIKAESHRPDDPSRGKSTCKALEAGRSLELSKDSEVCEARAWRG